MCVQAAPLPAGCSGHCVTAPPPVDVIVYPSCVVVVHNYTPGLMSNPTCLIHSSTSKEAG